MLGDEKFVNISAIEGELVDTVKRNCGVKTCKEGV